MIHACHRLPSGFSHSSEQTSVKRNSCNHSTGLNGRSIKARLGAFTWVLLWPAAAPDLGKARDGGGPDQPCRGDEGWVDPSGVSRSRWVRGEVTATAAALPYSED
ncbi:hypothetical protein GUJ93_ZPchr0007g6146 [Zizania palustris]|uniref:Uncharacterized protein n=1 Tax=Zizania palustris TaxID=103762 RepID=A0A8J5VYD3_ZIZPA|nr:hypothetical protein GUJ93_ZPchr0007g6146 [Zizania palustris]